jgi:hypothetical protein
MPPTSTRIRETTEEESRAKARERVARDARRGIMPSQAYSADDLAWAFAGDHEAELQELEEQAAEVPAAEAQHEESVQRRRELQAMTDRVLAEQEAERRSKAEAEGRKRLGWGKGERP